MIEINLQNFETEVIAACMTQPILLNFWSGRSGPCQIMAPLLAQLEVDYQGRFTLATINTDEQPQITQAFGVQSVPSCILMLDGKPVDGFAGALNKEQIEAFLVKHLPPQTLSVGASELELARSLLAAGKPEAALEKMSALLAVDADNNQLRYEYVRLLIEQGQHEAAYAALAPKLAEIPRPLAFDALAQWLGTIEFIAASPYASWSQAQFDEKIGANKRDFETRFAKARWLLVQSRWTEAMDELLEIIMRDKNWHEQAPRKLMVAILELLTPVASQAASSPGPKAGAIELLGKSGMTEDPQAALVSSYRRRLSMLLN